MDWSLKPFTMRQKRFWLFYYKFEILFEGDIIETLIGGFKYYDEMKNLTNKLNAAYNYGYARGKADK